MITEDYFDLRVLQSYSGAVQKHEAGTPLKVFDNQSTAESPPPFTCEKKRFVSPFDSGV